MTESRRRLFAGLLTVMVMIAFGATNGYAGDFVSFRGDFAISFPDDWQKIDYQSADYHLSRAGADLNYEAVIADSKSPAFYSGPYLILTFDSLGSLTSAQLDSLADNVASDFGHSVMTRPADRMILEPVYDKVMYDREARSFAIVSRMDEDTDSPRRNILAMKACNAGIANFYFYCPDSVFDANLETFDGIFASFTTDTKSALEVTPAPVAEMEEPFELSRTALIIIVIVVVGLIAAVLAVMRSRH